MNPSTYPDHIWSSARSLVLSGHSSRDAERILAQQHPDEPTPTYRAIARWRHSLSQEEEEAANQAHREILLRAQRLTLEELDQHPDKYNAVQLMTVAGIADDKLLKRLQLAQAASQPDHPTIIPVQIIVNAASDVASSAATVDYSASSVGVYPAGSAAAQKAAPPSTELPPPS